MCMPSVHAWKVLTRNDIFSWKLNMALNWELFLSCELLFLEGNMHNVHVRSFKDFVFENLCMYARMCK